MRVFGGILTNLVIFSFKFRLILKQAETPAQLSMAGPLTRIFMRQVMRKNFILAIVFLIVSTNLYGQEFGKIGTEWYYSEHAVGSCK